MNFNCVQKIAIHILKRIALCFALCSSALAVNATTVQIQTVMGDIEVNLYDKQTPKTVENFLAYVNEGAYSDIVIHRADPGFVVQGGGFTYKDAWPPVAIPQKPRVINEPVFSNVRGTIAMAKLRDAPNSATNQWFINLKDNSANLDTTNGGYTVFGQVTGNGMAIIDAMAALPRPYLDQKATSVFGEIPLRNYTTADRANNVVIDDDHLVIIQNIVVLNSSPDTADGLEPKKSIAVGRSSSGGSVNINLLSILLMLSTLLMLRVRIQRRK